MPISDARAATSKVFKPALVYQYAGEASDNAFINSALSGVGRAETDLDQRIKVVRMKASDNPELVIKKLADSGASPIILLGINYVPPVMKLAERYPASNFTIIDGLAPPLYPNVQSILFKDHEGAFLVGMIAGKVSNSKQIGFIGGMDIPLIRNFALGFTQGVAYAAPDAKVTVEMIGDNATAWSSPEKANSLAKAQFAKGADIIFAAAGGSSLGVLKAADETGKLAIGVDSNQNGIFPGRVLTSMVKRVDVAVYETLQNAHDGSWSAGIKYLGIKEGALDYAVDQHNRALIREQLIEDVATAKDRIMAGKIIIESYSAK